VGVIRQAAITIHDNIFLVDLFVMPLEGYDMVLGTQWLATLGPILCDFSGRSLTFKWHGKSVCWQGVPGAAHLTSPPPASPLQQELLAAIHEDDHEGVQRTLHRLRRDFHFPDMRRVIQNFVRACATCQRYKSEHLHPAGLLLPLPVLTAVWADIGIDFVKALPRVHDKSVILTMVDRFSKYCHFIPLAHPYSMESVAQAFFTDIVRVHGVPQSMVSDRDPVFTSTFLE
jgi:hypothetical protein